MGSNKTTYHFGNYECIEENNATTEQYFLDNDVILIKKDGELSFYKAFCDRQGSILSVFDIDGNKVFDASYDAWGRQTVRQNDINLQYGYCGHEMISDFDLINMGGRVYDPVIGRFLSCDNYVQEPDNSQNFNRYSYCLNNPLRYSDPGGELFGIDDLIYIGIIGAVINVGVQVCCGNKISSGDILSAAGVGAVAGIAAAYGGAYVASAVAPALGTGFWGGMVAGAASSSITIGVQGYGNNALLGTPLPSTNDWLLGIGGGAVIGGCMNGLYATSQNRSFLTGRSRYQTIPKIDGTPVTAGAEEQLRARTSPPDKSITLNQLFKDSSSPSLHLVHDRLPAEDVWQKMTSPAKGKYGLKLTLDLESAKIVTSQKASEVSLKVNGVTYKADYCYIGEKRMLHIVESKAGPSASFTRNQQLAIPALLNDPKVSVVPFGKKAAEVFEGTLPSTIERFQFDLYWFK